MFKFLTILNRNTVVLKDTYLSMKISITYLQLCT